MEAESTRLATRNDRFQGVQLGVSRPLWARPQAARSKAAAWQEEAAQHARSDGERRWRTELTAALQRIASDRATLVWYTEEALPNADRILTTSRTAFAAGEISHAEHVLNLQQALAIRRGHLDLIDAHNANVLLVQRLTAGQ